jgi:hypothetical protein
MYSSDALQHDVLLFEMLPNLYISNWSAAAHACRTKLLGPQVFVVNLANGKPLVSKHGVVIKVNDDGSPEAMQTLEGRSSATNHRCHESSHRQGNACFGALPRRAATIRGGHCCLHHEI